MADNKTISFKVLVDQTSAQQFSGVIGQMIKQLDQLTKSIGQASQAMGGLLGGGSIGGSRPISQIINQPKTAGGAFATTPAALGGTGPATKGASLADIFLKNASAFKGMADSSRAAMQTMTEALQKAIQASSRNLDALNAKLDEATLNYKKLAASSTGFEGSKLQAGMLSNMADIQVQAGTEKDNISKLKAMSAGGGGGGLGLLGAVGGLAGIIGLAANRAFAYAGSARDTNLMYSNLQAQQGALYGTAAQSLYNNDYRRLAAEYAMQRDPNAREELDRIATQGKTPESGLNIYGVAGAKAVFGKLIRGDIPGVGRALAAASQIEEQERMKDREALIQNTMGANPLEMQKMQSFYDTIGTRSSLARRLGYMYTGPGMKASSALYGYQFERLGLGGQEAAAISSIAGIGGEAAGKRYALSAAMAQTRGFGGAAQLYGMGAQGMGQDYVQRVLGGMGTADMQAGGQLGLGIANYAAGQGYGVADQSALLGAALNSGLYNKSGTDIHTTQQIMGGIQSLDRRFTGGIDPYGKALNLRAVIGGMPNASPYARDFAANMSFTEMNRLTSGGAPNLVEQGLGISGAALRPVMNMKMEDALRRFHGTDSTPAGRLAAAIRSSGKTTQEFLKSHAGFTDKETMVGLAGIIGGATPDISSDQAIGEMGIMMGRSRTDVRRMMKRAGLGDVIGTAESKANETQAKRNLELQKEFATNQDKYGAFSDKVAKTIEQYNSATQNATTTVEEFNAALRKTIEMITAEAMHNIREGVKKQSGKANAGNTHTQGTKHRIK